MRERRRVMNRRISFVLYIVLAVVCAAILVMTMISPSVGGAFSGMPIVIVLFCLAAAILVSLVAFNPRKNAYSIGFYILHIGIVMFLVGSFVFTVSGQKLRVDLMEGDDIYYNRVPAGEEVIDLGFSVRLEDFTEELYDDGSPRYYEAVLGFYDGTDEFSEVVTVNHPLYVGDWKIYLMGVSESESGASYVSFLFKNDSVEFISTAGIILTIIGTFCMCLIKPRDKMSLYTAGEKKDSPEDKNSGKGGAHASRKGGKA